MLLLSPVMICEAAVRSQVPYKYVNFKYHADHKKSTDICGVVLFSYLQFTFAIFNNGYPLFNNCCSFHWPGKGCRLSQACLLLFDTRPLIWLAWLHTIKTDKIHITIIYWYNNKLVTHHTWTILSWIWLLIKEWHVAEICQTASTMTLASVGEKHYLCAVQLKTW